MNKLKVMRVLSEAVRLFPENADVFAVGGCVRDCFLGVEPKDVDLVVVGMTPSGMEALSFSPTGLSAPVFRSNRLKDTNGNRVEVALARGEKKNGLGHNGFDFFLSDNLQDDLLRRDFTVNAMAFASNGFLVDPFNGLQDLQNKVLRHVGPAFSEDPLRVYRAARFAAKLGFTVAPETMLLMRTFS